MNQDHIRQATSQDACRIAEIEILGYRINFYPIFRDDSFYFGELQVASLMERHLTETGFLQNTYVYDDGVVKGFIHLDGAEVKKLFVEPVLQGSGIGAALLQYAICEKNASFLWALEKNARAIRFYERHGFHATGDQKPEEGTTEYLIRLERKKEFTER